MQGGTQYQVPGQGMVTRDQGGNIPDEFTQRYSNEPMTISMANAGRPNSGGSQIFINTVHNAYLDWFDTRTPSRHPVFGKVISGQDIVSRIGNCPTAQGDRPNPAIRVNRIIVVRE